MLASVNQVVGDQTPRVKDDNGTFFMFFSVAIGAEKSAIKMVSVKDGEGYPMLVDAIQSLPRNTLAFTPDELSMSIGNEYQRGFGTVFHDLGIVAHTGKSSADKPFASYVCFDGTTKYIKHPDILKKVRVI